LLVGGQSWSEFGVGGGGDAGSCRRGGGGAARCRCQTVGPRLRRLPVGERGAEVGVGGVDARDPARLTRPRHVGQPQTGSVTAGLLPRSDLRPGERRGRARRLRCGLLLGCFATTWMTTTSTSLTTVAADSRHLQQQSVIERFLDSCAQFTPPKRTRQGQDSFVVSGVAVRISFTTVRYASTIA